MPDKIITDLQEMVEEFKRKADVRNKYIAYLEEKLVSEWTLEQTEEARARYEKDPRQRRVIAGDYFSGYIDVSWSELTNAEKIKVMYGDG